MLLAYMTMLEYNLFHSKSLLQILQKKNDKRGCMLLVLAAQVIRINRYLGKNLYLECMTPTTNNQQHVIKFDINSRKKQNILYTVKREKKMFSHAIDYYFASCYLEYRHRQLTIIKIYFSIALVGFCYYFEILNARYVDGIIQLVSLYEIERHFNSL